MKNRKIEYLSFETDFFRSADILDIEHVHKGAKLIIIETLIEIANTKGFYVEWNQRTMRHIGRHAGTEIKLVDLVIKLCIEYGIFDSEMFDKKIITSREIQDNYYRIIRNKKRIVEIDQKELKLIILESDLSKIKDYNGCKIINRKKTSEKNDKPFNENANTSEVSGGTSEEKNDFSGNGIFEEVLNNENLKKTYSKFLQFRKEIKKKITPTQEEPLLEKLKKLSGGNPDTASAILLQSISSGWQGIFELKKKNNEKRNNTSGKSRKSKTQHNLDVAERLVPKGWVAPE